MINNKTLKFIKEMAQEDWNCGHPFDLDDYGLFVKTVEECGFKPTEELFTIYFEFLDEIRAECY